ncbi:MAG: DUF134 domain-containing protein [Methanospirillum sp.]
MNGTGDGKPHCPRRGRPRMNRSIQSEGPLRCFAPQCKTAGDVEPVSLLPAEIEVLRLVDLEGLQQEEAATVLRISRKTLWRDLHEARRKVADALVNGRLIEMAVCSCAEEGVCPRRTGAACPRAAEGDCPYLCDPDHDR